MKSSLAVAVALVLALVPDTPAAEQPVALADRDFFSCGGAPFPRAAISSPRGVELTGDPAARELRRFLEDPAENVDFEFPRRGWLRLVQTPQAAVFGWAKRDGRIRLDVHVANEAGRWTVDGFGYCRPMLSVPGIEATPWTLKRLPVPSARTVHLVLHTGSCNPERPRADIRKRFDHVEVAQNARTIRLLALIRDTPLAPGQICAGVGFSYPLTVRLPERLGRRVLRDAAFLPSERIADLRSGRCFGHCGPF